MTTIRERRREVQARKGVPRAALAAIVEEWLEKHGRDHPLTFNGGHTNDQAGALKTLVFHTGVPERMLYFVRTGNQATRSTRKGESHAVQREWVTPELADRILVGIGHPEYWWTRLEDVDKAA